MSSRDWMSAGATPASVAKAAVGGAVRVRVGDDGLEALELERLQVVGLERLVVGVEVLALFVGDGV